MKILLNERDSLYIIYIILRCTSGKCQFLIEMENKGHYLRVASIIIISILFRFFVLFIFRFLFVIVYLLFILIEYSKRKKKWVGTQRNIFTTQNYLKLKFDDTDTTDDV